MVLLGRRTALLAGVAIGGTPGLIAAGLRGAPPGLARSRVELTSGVRSGEVTTSSAVLWGRASGDGRLSVRLSSNGRVLRDIRGGWADERADYTARMILDGLAPGRQYDADLSFTSADGAAGRTERVSFRTAAIHP